jgi:hypothetical protein
MDGYRSAEWHKFRETVLRLDGNACRQCGRGRSEGVRLHVHHTRYIAGRMPWEYPYDMCDTLCSGCHAAEHGIIPPKFGWTFIGCDDLGDLTGECDYCGTAIRHSFLVQHAQWRAMEVGEFCCDNLTSTQVATGHLESVRRHLDRRKRFVSSTRWVETCPGVQRVKQKGCLVEIVQCDGIYRLRVAGRMGRKAFPTMVEGKAHAFDVIESGALKRWLSEKNALLRRS